MSGAKTLDDAGIDDLIASVVKTCNDITKAASRRAVALKESCKSTLDALANSQLVAVISGTETECSELIARIIVTMGVACETKTTKIVNFAIEALQKILSSGFVHGLMPQSVPISLAILGESSPQQRPIVKAVDLIVAIVSGCFLGQEAPIHVQILKVCQIAATKPSCQLHGFGLVNAVRTCFNILLFDETRADDNTAKQVLSQIIQHVFQRYERECVIREADAANQRETIVVPTDESVASESADEIVDGDEDSQKVGQEEKKEKETEDEEDEEEKDESFNDCFLLFRALCKMAAREPAPKSKDQEVRKVMYGKEVSLELLYGIVESAGPALCQDPRFVEKSIKKYLCTTLVQNGVSMQPRVFKFTLSVFVSLLKKFKVQLRSEIGVFFSNIFLRVLESPHSTLQQKWMVLQLLLHICRDPQSLIDLYVNYDCDLDSTDILVRMVNDISKTAQGVYSGDGSGSGSSSGGGDNVGGGGNIIPASEQELHVRTLGLKCLVKVLKSLSDWTKEGTSIAPSTSPALPNNASSPNSLSPASLANPDIPTTPTLAASLGASEDDVTDEELMELRKNKQKKQTLEEIKSRWALDAKRAIEYMKKLELIDDTPASLAQFLYSTDGLDKKVLGDFLGGSKPFNKSVLHEYVCCFSFAGMQLDEALRYFLGMFLLPGEGQVVDRIMENFGAQYYKSNSKGTPFEDADAVYKLSFAIIMLATDLHNPKIKNKLTFADFDKMVNKDLAMNMEESFLKGIFDRIAAKKLELLDSSGTGGQVVISDYLNAKQRQQLFVEETNKWVATSMKQMRAQRGQSKEFHHAKRIEYVQPIFESIWASAVVALSVLLESGDNPGIVQLCMNGFKYAIHVSCVFEMETERTTFIGALEKFTLLNNLREMHPKNISVIKTLISIASEEGNYLQSSWLPVLNCVSLLERLHLLGSGIRPDIVSNPADNADIKRASNSRRRSSPSDSESFSSHVRSSSFMPTPQSPVKGDVSAVEVANSRAVSMDIDPLSIDKLFNDSVSLSDFAIIHFVRALCEVSLSEIHNPTPRIFSLQKIVEVASFNMNIRMRLVWHDIWMILQEHFISCGCHEMPAVSLFAMDSLRQLAMKYLEKDELADFNFQKEFLKPFEVVVASTCSKSVKEFVVQSLHQLVTTRTPNICSGWKSIFAILSTCACEKDEEINRSIVPAAFDVLTDIVKSRYSYVSQKFFNELIDSLASFGKNEFFPAISIKSIAMLFSCVSNIDPKGPLPSSFSADEDDEEETKIDGATPEELAAIESAKQQRRIMKVWSPILTELSSIVAHKNIDVRSSALDTLFEILAEYGEQFTVDFWGVLFRGALFPLFDSVGYNHGKLDNLQDYLSWLTTTCMPTLEHLVGLFEKYYSSLVGFIPDFLVMLEAFIVQNQNKQLSGFGTKAFFSFMEMNYKSFSDDIWELMSNLLTGCLEADANLLSRILAGVIVKPSEASNGAEGEDSQTQKCCCSCKKDVSDGLYVSCPICNHAIYCCSECQVRDTDTHIVQCLQAFARKNGEDSRIICLVPGYEPLLSVLSRSTGLTVECQKTEAKPPEDVDPAFDRATRIMGGVADFVNKHGVDALNQKSCFRFIDELGNCVAASSLLTSVSSIRSTLRTKYTDLYSLMAQKLYLMLTHALLVLPVSTSSSNYEFAEPRHFALAQALYAQSDIMNAPASSTMLDSLNHLLALSDEEYRKHIVTVYPYLSKFVVHADPEVRSAVQKHFERIGSLFILPSASQL